MKEGTVADVFRTTARECSDRIAVRTLDRNGRTTLAWTWGELHSKVDVLARGLHELGVAHGDCVALLLRNRPEFHLCDLAVMTLGAVSFSIYATSAPEQIQHLMADSHARTLITEQAFLDRLDSAGVLDDRSVQTIVIDKVAPPSGRILDEVQDLGSRSDFDIDARVASLHHDDVLTLIYTSGTTGQSKGVELTHRNVLGAFRATETRVLFPSESRVISWLPAAHIAERLAHHYLPMAHGAEITCCEDATRILDYLQAVRPTWFFGVPRVWEKLKTTVEQHIDSMAESAGVRTREAVAGSLRKVQLEQSGKDVPLELTARVRASKDVFLGLRERIGLDRVATANVGAAPTPPEILEFFHAIGVPLSELWGMSESTGAGCSHPPADIRIGSIGTAAPGVEVRVADDGEVLMRGDVVMRGYRNQPSLTAETIIDGWLHTGDLATIGEDGYIQIIDRKKDIIINAMGKNMSPAFIESRLKAASSLIAHACVIGDRRPYNTALIVLEPTASHKWAADDPRTYEVIDEAVRAANARLSRVEQIKRFTILGGEWQPSGEELTPTMKLKRQSIAAKYRADIERMYHPGPDAMNLAGRS